MGFRDCRQGLCQSQEPEWVPVEMPARSRTVPACVWTGSHESISSSAGSALSVSAVRIISGIAPRDPFSDRQRSVQYVVCVSKRPRL